MFLSPKIAQIFPMVKREIKEDKGVAEETCPRTDPMTGIIRIKTNKGYLIESSYFLRFTQDFLIFLFRTLRRQERSSNFLSTNVLIIYWWGDKKGLEF